MKNTWFTSDTHFGHRRMVVERGFCESIDVPPEVMAAAKLAHDQQLIDNWNEFVDPGDDVFHLGDISFSNRLRSDEILKQLNGTKHHVRGNHDRNVKGLTHRFQWVKDLHAIKVGNQRITLCHFSMEVWNRSHKGAWHLYGHSHNSLPERMTHRSIDVGVDAVAARVNRFPQGVGIRKLMEDNKHMAERMKLDFRPIHFDEVAQIMATKEWAPVDHHNESTD